MGRQVVIIRADRGVASLTDVRELTALSLELVGPRDQAVGSWGRWADDRHVVVPADLLVRLAGDVADEPGWREDFGAMIAYAERNGWMDADGGVRVHVSAG